MVEVKMKMFDCVEMKRRGARQVQQEIAGMTVQEELAYWRHGTSQLRERQAERLAEAALQPADPLSLVK